MRIIQATDTITVDHPIFLIVGQPGICKSTLGFTFNTLLLDFDQGAHRVENRGATALIDSWADVDVSARTLAPYDGVTIDTVERCLGMMTAALLDEDASNGRNGTLYAKGWGLLKQRFSGLLDGLLAQRKDLLLLAHAKEVRDGDRKVVRPDIPGGSLGEVMKRADFVGYLSMVGGRRVLDFSTTDRFIGKNSGEWLPMPLPGAQAMGGFMAELFEEGRAALGRRSTAHAEVAAQVATWQRLIGTYTRAADFTTGLEDLRKLKTTAPAVYAQAHHLLAQAARAGGMKYRAELAAFVDTGVRPPVEAPRRVVSAAPRAATWQPALLSELTSGVRSW